MLERTAGCLEGSTLRRLLPTSRKLSKSRRLLHSSFWDHGAAELELSPIWTALIGATTTACKSQANPFRLDGSSASGLFLDFLYPFGAALKSVRQWSLSNSERHDGRRIRSSGITAAQRPFTSVAGDTALQYDSILREDTSSTAHKSENDSKISLTFLKRLLRTTTKSYDAIWRYYEALESQDRGGLTSQVLEYLSTSDRLEDSERAIMCFHEIERSSTTHSDYRALIQSYLTLDKYEDAIDVYRECLNVLDRPIAADLLLERLLRRSKYSEALEIWTSFTRHQKSKVQLSDDIWNVFQGRADYQQVALDLSYNIDLLDQSTDAIVEPTWDEFQAFLTDLLFKALFPSGFLIKFDSSIFSEVFAELTRWNLDTSEIYESSIEQLISIDQFALAIDLYQRYRSRTNERISRFCLDGLLKVAVESRDVQLASIIKEDWNSYYGEPSLWAYRALMRVFATAGHVSTVRDLFERYIIRRPRVISNSEKLANDFAPLLQVHAVRGEVEEGVEVFDGMESTYGVAPSILCWNALLNAYRTAHNIDGAFERFDRLCNSSILPTHHTFGIMIAMCVDHGDLEQAVDLIQLAKLRKIEPNIIMLSHLVNGYCQDRKLAEAEKVCRDSLHLSEQGSLTWMWNHLLRAYALQRDITNVNRILQLMKESDIEFNDYTYAALMQSLCMVGQPDRARDIMMKVMPQAGLAPTGYHYAIVMGGYLHQKQARGVFRLYAQMRRLKMKEADSVKHLVLQAAGLRDLRKLAQESEEVRLKAAEEMFHEITVLSMKGGMELSQGPTSDIVQNSAVDTVVFTRSIEYLIFMYGQHNMKEKVKKLYEMYQDALPEEKRDGTATLAILNSMMVAEQHHGDHDAVLHFWRLAFEQAKKVGLPVKTSLLPQRDKILPNHRFDLAKHLTTVMISLSHQAKYALVDEIIRDMHAVGFALDRKNYNIYVQLLTQAQRFKEAFQTCEKHLMPGWTGWARARWAGPARNRLPVELRYLKKDWSFGRPLYDTLVLLAKTFMDLGALAMESRAAADLLRFINSRCPMTVYAIQTMQRSGDELERIVFGDD